MRMCSDFLSFRVFSCHFAFVFRPRSLLKKCTDRNAFVFCSRTFNCQTPCPGLFASHLSVSDDSQLEESTREFRWQLDVKTSTTRFYLERKLILPDKRVCFKSDVGITSMRFFDILLEGSTMFFIANFPLDSVALFSTNKVPQRDC